LTNIFDQLLSPVIWIDSAAFEINSYSCKNRENFAIFAKTPAREAARPTFMADMTKNGTSAR
jgi:hypothetical protein